MSLSPTCAPLGPCLSVRGVKIKFLRESVIFCNNMLGDRVFGLLYLTHVPTAVIFLDTVHVQVPESRRVRKAFSQLWFSPFVFSGPGKGDPGVPGDHVVVDGQDGLGVHPHPSHLGMSGSGSRIKPTVWKRINAQKYWDQCQNWSSGGIFKIQVIFDNVSHND